MKLKDKKPQKSLFWHQGLFLQPQHFQYSDLYHQTSYYPMIEIANPYFWGVARLEINEGAYRPDRVEHTEQAGGRGQDCIRSRQRGNEYPAADQRGQILG